MKGTEPRRGLPCPYKPILCETRLNCEGCQIYKDFQGHERTMGRKRVDTTAEWARVRGISSSIYPIQSLRNQIQAKRDEVFNSSLFGNLESQVKFEAMVNAYDVVLELIDGGEK